MESTNKVDMDLVLFVVHQKEGRKVIRLCKDVGVMGATIFFGEGVSKNPLLRSLGLDTHRQEIVMVVAPTETAHKTLDHVAGVMNVKKKGHLVGLRLPLKNVLGLKNRTIKDLDKLDEHRSEKENENMYQAIMIVAELGMGSDIMDVAEKEGATGGTILRGKGAGSSEASRVFNMEIEPEKDVLLIVAKNEKVSPIADAISDFLNIEGANRGILFTMELHETRGLLD